MVMITGEEYVHGLRKSDCPIKVGYTVGRYVWGLIGPKVVEVGSFVRVGGGWVVPVKLRRLFGGQECALLRYLKGDGETSVDTVVELRSEVWSCFYNLRHSMIVPKVVEGPDSGVLYLHVQDDEGYTYELRLTGICGPHGEDTCVQVR